MSTDHSTLHFVLTLAAGLLAAISGFSFLYVLEHAYGIAAAGDPSLLMTAAALTIAASLAILNWREDFDAMLDGQRPLTQHTVFRVWLAIFVFWFVVVIAGSVNAQRIQGEEWYLRMPGALVFYIVPTLLWLHLTRLIVKTRYLKKGTDVRAS